MPEVPAIVVEGIAYATGRPRDSIRNVIAEMWDHFKDKSGDLSRQLGGLLAQEKSEAVQADGLTRYASATLTSETAIKNRLMTALGFAFVGGLVLSMEGILATIVGIALLAVAGLIVFGLLKRLLSQLSDQFSQL